MIYLIADKERKYCKIGHSKNPKNRLITLQIGSPVEVEIILTKEGTCETEKFLHEKFKQYKLRGEWFIFNTEIVDYIRNTVEIPKKRSNSNRNRRLRAIEIWNILKSNQQGEKVIKEIKEFFGR